MSAETPNITVEEARVRLAHVVNRHSTFDGVEGTRIPPTLDPRLAVNWGVRESPGQGLSMQLITTGMTTVGLDLVKHVFQVHGIDKDGRVIIRKPLRRKQVMEFFQRLPPCLVGMEACATAHYQADGQPGELDLQVFDGLNNERSIARQQRFALGPARSDIDYRQGLNEQPATEVPPCATMSTSQKPGGGLFQSLNIWIGTFRRIADEKPARRRFPPLAASSHSRVDGRCLQRSWREQEHDLGRQAAMAGSLNGRQQGRNHDL